MVAGEEFTIKEVWCFKYVHLLIMMYIISCFNCLDSQSTYTIRFLIENMQDIAYNANHCQK